MELKFKGLGFTWTLYAVPAISHNGWIAAWWGVDAKWKHGFVVRLLWLGFVLRWGPYKKPSWKFWNEYQERRWNQGKR